VPAEKLRKQIPRELKATSKSHVMELSGASNRALPDLTPKPHFPQTVKPYPDTNRNWNQPLIKGNGPNPVAKSQSPE
jgi:hypothetical protein